jgi:hypothetical protein
LLKYSVTTRGGRWHTPLQGGEGAQAGAGLGVLAERAADVLQGAGPRQVLAPSLLECQKGRSPTAAAWQAAHWMGECCTPEGGTAVTHMCIPPRVSAGATSCWDFEGHCSRASPGPDHLR